jgi:hypothetical protein
MTDTRNLEGRISLWMEDSEAGTHYPDRLLSATFEQTRDLRQARSLRRSFPVLRSPRSLAAAGATTVVLLVVGALGLYFGVNPPGPTSSPSPSPNLTAPPSPGSSSPPGYMWPQTTLDEVRAAQELADAGDVRHTWQVDHDLGGAGAIGQHHPGDAKIFTRFLEEVLGWEEYRDGHHVPRRDGSGLNEGDFVFIRCARDETNPLYPADPEGGECAPTIDELSYETVKITVAQPDRQLPGGIWVVTGWEMIGPAVQAHPRVVEAEASALVEDFLQARIGGDGAEELLNGSPDEQYDQQMPLLYATSTGAPYERSEFELVEGPTWPRGGMRFEIRLFARNDESVVEQRIYPERLETGRLDLSYDHERGTTENGKAVPVEYSFLDGELTLLAAAPLAANSDEYRDLVIEDDSYRPILQVLADPTPFAADCTEAGAPTDAAALAGIIGSNPRFEATAPVGVTIGGIPALQMDVVRPGAGSCLWSEGDISESGPLLKYARWEPMWDRARIYLLDLPEGSKARVLALVIVTDEDSLESTLEVLAPVIDSIEFHGP